MINALTDKNVIEHRFVEDQNYRDESHAKHL
jgi:hypothetical protein